MKNKEKKNIVVTSLEYIDYIVNHRANLWRIWYEVWPSLTKSFHLKEGDLVKVPDLIIKHDNSKFSVEEFEPYRNYFYPAHGQKVTGVEDAMNMAYRVHIWRNPHHWQHWFLAEDDGNDVSYRMPVENIVELLCDWGAMKFVYADTTIEEWYNQRKETIRLHHHSKKVLENLIPYYDLAVEHARKHKEETIEFFREVERRKLKPQIKEAWERVGEECADERFHEDWEKHKLYLFPDEE